MAVSGGARQQQRLSLPVVERSAPLTAGTALLTACSPGYNLGLDKLGTWLRSLGWKVAFNPLTNAVPGGFDLYAFSVIFTWDLPALALAVKAVPSGADSWIGGPAASAMPTWVEEHTGVVPIVGPDPRFERQQGEYKWCRTTRGCPVGCYFCIVPKIDGTTMLEYPDFNPAPVVVDDNILRSSWRHQRLVVERLAAADFKSIDFNSGFEPLFFEQKHVDLYGQLPLKYWRIAFDEIKEAPEVERAIRLLRANDVPSKKIFCYVLAGNEPFADCLWRAQKVVEWGGEPRIQMMKPLTWLQPRKAVWINPKHDWTQELSINFPRYWYSYAWRRVEWEDWVAAGYKYDGEMTSEGLGKLRATRASATSRWLAPTPDSDADDLETDTGAA
jgi:hypothetical protein